MVAITSHVPIPFRIIALVQEQNNLLGYPLERLATMISELGFRCTGCGQCCTRDYSGHVFLLDRDADATRRIDPAALVPAPCPEFCDQNGIIYIPGYALRTKGDAAGSCWFLEDRRCQIYDQRFSACRTFPFTLHREPFENGKLEWRCISPPLRHGAICQEVTADECLTLAREIKEHEHAVISHEIEFLEFIRAYFSDQNLRHDQHVFDLAMQRFSRGGAVTVRVYSDQDLAEYRCRGSWLPVHGVHT